MIICYWQSLPEYYLVSVRLGFPVEPQVKWISNHHSKKVDNMSVKYGILTLLFRQKQHGYELKLGLDALLGTKDKINPGQVYTTLDRLIRDGFVSSPGTDE